MTAFQTPLRTAARLALAAVLLASLLFTGACSTNTTGRDGDRLINPLLGPNYSSWMIGPAARMATPEELDEYAALRDDAAAVAFVDGFWERRDPKPLRPDNPLREQFEERSAEADQKFSEAGISGRRTARGTIWILFGEPAETDYEIPIDHREPPVEVWEYDKEAEKGLDGAQPAPIYRFIKRGEVTEFYVPRTRLDERRGVIDIGRN